MRIPTQTLPTVAPERLPAPNLSTGVRGLGDASAQALQGVVQSTDRLGRGFAQAASTVERDVEAKQRQADKEAAEAKQKAIAAQTAEAEAKLQDRYTTRMHGDTENADILPEKFTKGFLTTRGEESSRVSAETLDVLRKDREEIGGGLTTPEAQQLFQARTTSMYASARRQVEDHVTRENQAALQASVKSTQDAALRSIALNPLGLDAARATFQAEGPTAALALPGQGEAEVTKWRGKVAATRLDALLNPATKDWQGAEVVLKEAGEDLPPKVRLEAERQIGIVRADVESERIASAAVAMATDDATAKVDIEAALALVATAPDDLREKVGKLVDHKLVLATKAAKQKIDERAAPLWEQLFKEQTLASVDARAKDWLQKNAREEWDALEKKEAWYLAQDRAASAAARAGKRAADKTPPKTDAQRDAMIDFLDDKTKNPGKYHRMTRAEFTREWAPRLSDRDYEAAGREFAKTKDDDQVSAGEFARFVSQEVKLNHKNKRDAAEFGAAMGDRRRAFLKEHKREPTPDELEVMKSSANATVVRRWFQPDSKAYKAEAEAKREGKPPPPPPAQVPVKSPKGKPYMVDEAGLDDWLSKHPGWTK